MLSSKYQINGINRRGMDRLSIRNASHIHSMVGTPLSKGRETRRRKEEDKMKLRKEVFCLAFRLTNGAQNPGRDGQTRFLLFVPFVRYGRTTNAQAWMG